MTSAARLLWSSFATAVLIGLCSLSILSAAQVQGNNAVYNSKGNCSTSSQCAGSSAFIDANALINNPGNQASDICDVIYKTLGGIIQTSYTSLGAVIDARGVSGSALNCTKGSPWSENGIYVTQPSPATILLPAGTITASFSWVLPTNTKLIGVAKGTGNSYVLETTIKAGFSSGAVVQFGDGNCPSSGCQGISVEQVTINGNAQTVNGIENDNCGLLCYVDHVTMYQVLGTGLTVSGANATDSGPYSNITFDVGGSPASSTQCAQIIGTSGTRGIHGLTCIASPDASNAVLLDASNNSLEALTRPRSDTAADAPATL
jgi:hypothetical protein